MRVVDGKRHGLILRRDPPTTAKAGAGIERTASGPRHRVSRAGRRLQRRRARAARCCSSSAPQDGLGEGFVMRRVDGTAIARKLLRDPPYAKARTMIAGQLGEILARIHAVDLARPAAAASIARPPTTSPACAAPSMP